MAPNLYYSVIVDGQWQMLLQHVAQHTRKVRFLMLRMAAFLTEQLHWQNFGRLAVAVESTNLVSTLLIHEHIARSLSPAISLSLFLSISFGFVWFARSKHISVSSLKYV